MAGASTFAWANSESRNIMLDLTYTVTQNQPVKLWGGKDYTFASLKQGRVVDPEVDAFGYGRAAGHGLPPLQAGEGRQGKRPLIIWLHGGGEGGWSQAYNNDLPLLANRGALGFITPKAQRIFGGAYVLAPQANDFWLNDPAMGYSARLKALIDKVVRNNPRIDRSRIYVVGASNGGYMSPKLVVDNPRFFAAVVPIAPALIFNGTTMISDAQLAADQDPHLGGAVEGRPGAAVRRQRPAHGSHDSGRPADRLRQRHLGRRDLQRPLVLDLRRPQRSDDRLRPAHLAVDGQAAPGSAHHHK